VSRGVARKLAAVDRSSRACYNRDRQRGASGVSRFPSRVSKANGARGKAMKNPLDSLWGTIISGLVLTVILYFVVKSLLA
jgi:hypothetical protein